MIYITEYYKDGLKYSGRVEGITFLDAKIKAYPNKVVGRLVSEIPLDINGNADFSKEKDYDKILCN